VTRRRRGGGLLWGGGSGSGYTADAVNFPGSGDYLTRGAGLTGAANSKRLLASWWYKPAVDGVLQQFIHSAGSKTYIPRNSANKLQIQLNNPSASNVWAGRSTSSLLVAGGWHHILLSIDAGLGERHLYINDVLEVITSEVFVDDTMDFTETDWFVGIHSVFINDLNGDLADFYFAQGQHLLLTTEANRRKFTDASGKPVDLGPTGLLPTGTQPTILFSGPFADWHTNKGTGGGFTKVGDLAPATTSPSD